MWRRCRRLPDDAAVWDSQPEVASPGVWRRTRRTALRLVASWRWWRRTTATTRQWTQPRIPTPSQAPSPLIASRKLSTHTEIDIQHRLNLFIAIRVASTDRQFLVSYAAISRPAIKRLYSKCVWTMKVINSNYAVLYKIGGLRIKN